MTNLRTVGGIPAKFFTVTPVRFKGGAVGTSVTITSPETGAETVQFTLEEADAAWRLMRRVYEEALAACDDAGT